MEFLFQVGFDLFSGMYSVRYFAVYRRSTFDSVAVSYITDLLDCLSVYGNVNRTVVIVGDFNLPKIDWDSYTGLVILYIKCLSHL